MNTPKTIFMRFVMTALLIALLATTVGTTLAVNGSYTVQPGDSLTKIARVYNTTVAALVDANKVQFPCLTTNAACLQVGWVISIPGGGAATGTGTGTGTVNATTTTNPGTYTVQKNDSVSKIATKFGVTYSALIAANKVSRPCLANTPPCALQIGWVLTIPGGAKPATSTNTAGATGVGTAPTGDPASIIGQYVAAINSRNAAALKAMLHPDVIDANTDSYIAELFRYVDIYQLTFTANESRTVSQSAAEAQVFYAITGESGNNEGFGTDASATILLKPYMGTWRFYDAEAGRIEFVR